MFLTHYANLFLHTTWADSTSITVYCDSTSVITCIQWHLAAKVTYPNHTIEDDYDVYSTIAQVVRQMQPLAPTFRHVKGHQDNNTR